MKLGRPFCRKNFGRNFLAGAPTPPTPGIPNRRMPAENLFFSAMVLLLATAGCGYHTVGHSVQLPASLKTIAWEGRILIIGFAGGTVPQIPANILLVKNCSVIGFYWSSYRTRNPALLRSSFETLLGWVAEGRLQRLNPRHSFLR